MKEAIQAKKDALKDFSQKRSSSDLQSWYFEARSGSSFAVLAVKMLKKRSWKEFGRRLDSNYSLANKKILADNTTIAGKSLNITTSIKNSTWNILRNEKEILSRWKNHLKIC